MDEGLWAFVDLGIGEPNIKTNSQLLEFCLKLEHWDLIFVPIPVSRFKSMSGRTAFNVKVLSLPLSLPYLSFSFHGIGAKPRQSIAHARQILHTELQYEGSS